MSTQSNPRSFQRDILSSMFDGIINIVKDSIVQCGGKVEDFEIDPYPLTINRIDGKDIDRNILLAIQEKLLVSPTIVA